MSYDQTMLLIFYIYCNSSVYTLFLIYILTYSSGRISTSPFTKLDSLLNALQTVKCKSKVITLVLVSKQYRLHLYSCYGMLQIVCAFTITTVHAKTLHTSLT